MKRIVLFSDSLALPRHEPEETRYEDTYPFLLRSHFEIHQFSKGGALIKELFDQTFYYTQYKPDIVILHCGIVDCACRAFTHKEEMFFESNPLGHAIRALFSKTITTKRIRDFRRKAWTEPLDFSCYCEKFKEAFSGIPVYALSILPACDAYEKKVPGIRNKVDQYNGLLKHAFGDKMIDLSSIPADGIMSDCHHLNKNGHLYVYSRIFAALDDNDDVRRKDHSEFL